MGILRVNRKPAFLLTMAAIMASATSAQALDFEFIKIADTSTAIPTAGGVFSSLSSPQLDGYTVGFQGSKAGYTGLFLSSAGTLTRAVDTTSIIPGGSGPFTTFNGFSVDSGQLAFSGSGSSQQGIYTTGAAGLARVADLTTPIPNGTGSFTSFSAPSMSTGNVAFVGNGAGQQGVYSTANGLHVVADGNTAIPGGTGNFSVGGFTSPSINFSDVAFRGAGSGGQVGAFTTVGGLQAIATNNTSIPGGVGKFTDFGSVSTSFAALAWTNLVSSTINGVYTDAGGPLQVVADMNTAIPGGTGNFTGFGPVSHYGFDTAFLGTGAGGQQGLYTTVGGQLTPVLDKTTILDGKTITSLSTAQTQAMNNGNFVFSASFSDGSSGIYVAEQNYNWAPNTSGNWDSAANWSFGLAPRTVVYTEIHPDNGIVVTGPAQPTTIRGLDIGANSNGEALLQLQPGGQLTVNEFLTIDSLGGLNINGSVATAIFDTSNFGDLNLGGGQLSGGQLFNYGTLRGSGTVGTSVQNNGTIQALSTTLHITGGLDNTEEFQIINAQVQIDGQTQNLGDGGVSQFGEMDIRNSILEFTGGLDNTNLMNFSFGTTDVFGAVTNDTNGQIIISGNSNVTFYNRLIHNGSVFRISPGSTAIFFGLVSGAGSFTGGGNKIFEGGFSPGNSPAAVSLDGPVTFDITNTLFVELGGSTPGTGYDHVHVNGQLNIDGALQVSLINGYVPNVGDTFNVLDWSTETGSFASVPSATVQGILNLFWTTTQNASNVNITLNRAFYDVEGGVYPQAFIGGGVEVVKSSAATATVSGNNSYTGPTTVNAGTLIVANPNALGAGLLNIQGTSIVQLAGGLTGSVKLTSLSIANNGSAFTGKLDLTNDKLIYESTGSADKASKISDLNAAITSGSNGGTWTGTGITSSTAAANSGHYAVGVFDNAVLQRTAFGGQSADSNSILVTLAHIGDANDDGVVDLQDLSIITNHWQKSGTNWANGDLNRDGLVDLGDLSLVTNNWQQTSIFPLEADSLPGLTGTASSAVPEPGSLALVCLSTMALVRRRRRTGP